MLFGLETAALSAVKPVSQGLGEYCWIRRNFKFDYVSSAEDKFAMLTSLIILYFRVLLLSTIATFQRESVTEGSLD